MSYVTLVAAITNLFGFVADTISVCIFVEEFFALAAVCCFAPLLASFLRLVLVRYLVQLVAVWAIVLVANFLPLALLCDPLSTILVGIARFAFLG